MVFIKIYSIFQLLSDNTILGQIRNLRELRRIYTYYKDVELATQEKMIVFYLEVTKNGITYVIDDENPIN